MATQAPDIALTNGRMESPRPNAVIRDSAFGRRSGDIDWLRILPAWIVSMVFHVVILIIFGFLFFPWGMGNVTASVEAPLDSEGQLEETAKAQDLTPTEVGIIPGEDPNFNNSRIAEVSIPGPVDLTANIGTKD